MSAPGMVVEAAPVRLNAAEFELAWTALDMGEVPLVLQVRPVGRLLEEFSDAMAGARQRLARRGLWDARHGPTDELSTVLQPLDRASAEFDLRVSGPDSRWRALAATRGGDTVMAVHRDEVLTLTPISEFSMPAAILSSLPDVPPGTGQLNGPTRQMNRQIAAAKNDSYRLSQALTSFGGSQRDVSSLVQAMLSIDGISRIGASTREAGGMRRRAPSIVSLVDTRMGRYVVSETATPGGESWTTWSPAEPRWVHTKVGELIGG